VLSMTRETLEHLEHSEAAIQRAKQLLAVHGYPDDLRTVMVIGFITQLIEHHESMLLLIRADKVGSAFALARSPIEGMYRGMWINFSATDAQVARFERNDDIGLNMTQLAQAIDAAYHAGDFFEDLKRRSWDALNSYAHTGVLQLGRRFREGNVEPGYTDGGIFEITTSVTTCILLLIGRFLAAQGHADESRAAEALIETYGPLRRRTGGNHLPGALVVLSLLLTGAWAVAHRFHLIR
jgi:hypothetical protein